MPFTVGSTANMDKDIANICSTSNMEEKREKERRKKDS